MHVLDRVLPAGIDSARGDAYGIRPEQKNPRDIIRRYKKNTWIDIRVWVYGTCDV